MKTIVCIKQVPTVSGMAFDPETRTLKREGVRSEVSSFDVRAVIRAVELRERHGGEVTVLTMGPPDAEAALRHCLALGADRAIHLCDRAFAGSDTLATARALAAAIEREPFDLVLCGRNSTDAETGQVGPEVAELLDLPQVSGARTLEIDPEKRTLRAERETDTGVQTVESPLPALVSAAEALAEERFPKKADREAAAEKPLETWDTSRLGGDTGGYGASGSPTWVAGLETVEEDRRCEMIEGESADALAAALVERLLELGLFGDWKIGSADRPQPAAESVQRSGASDILVVAEAIDGRLRAVTHELLGAASRLARQLGSSVSTLLMGSDLEAAGRDLAATGAARMWVADHESLRHGDAEVAAAVLQRVIEESAPGMILLPSTVFGRDVAPRLAARLGLGLTGDCVDLTLDDEGNLVQHKPAFGGQVVAPVLSRTRPELATVRPGMLEPGSPAGGGRSEHHEVPAPPVTPRVRVLAEEREGERFAALDTAEVVLGLGMGVGAPENQAPMRELAEALGAVICTTRDVTDKGWLPKQLQVGITGRAIAPKLYLAVGIRGAFEHMVGVRRAGVIVAVNNKPKAMIFRSADYGVVADWNDLVPALTRRLRTERKRRE